MTMFRKNVKCPTSEKLLAFQNSEVADYEKDKIAVHLRFCEFCAAEIELYARHPQADEKIERAEIPLPLYELAQALLNNKKKDFIENMFAAKFLN